MVWGMLTGSSSKLDISSVQGSWCRIKEGTGEALRVQGLGF